MTERTLLKQTDALIRKNKWMLALLDKGNMLARKEIAGSKRKIKQIGLKLKAQPEQLKLKTKLAELERKVRLLNKIQESFAAFKEELNRELGWLTNEAAKIKDLTYLTKALRAEQESMERQRALVAELFKLVDELRKRPAAPAK